MLLLSCISCGDEGMGDGLDKCLKVCQKLESCLPEGSFEPGNCSEYCYQQIYYDSRALDCALWALDAECSADYVNYCNGESGVEWK